MSAIPTLAILCALLTAQPNHAFVAQQKAPTNLPAPAVSLIRLIATPKDFDGKRLRLAGYLGGAGPDQSLGLYLSSIDARNYIEQNSIGVDDRSEAKLHDLIGRYVVLAAVFHAPDPRWGSNGYIDQITDFRKWPPIEPK
jgi:hypothetical protein